MKKFLVIASWIFFTVALSIVQISGIVTMAPLNVVINLPLFTALFLASTGRWSRGILVGITSSAFMDIVSHLPTGTTIAAMSLALTVTNGVGSTFIKNDSSIGIFIRLMLGFGTYYGVLLAVVALREQLFQFPTAPSNFSFLFFTMIVQSIFAGMIVVIGRKSTLRRWI